MKMLFAIVGVFLLLNFAAFAQIPSDANLRIRVDNLSETNFSGIISNTEPDISYEIQRKQGRTDWISVGLVLGSETTNWTPFNFKISGDINPKTVLRVRSWQDDGSGLPLWWQLKYFGSVGIDPYGNPEGDGWNNMKKFQNGMDPFKWYVPPKPVINAKFYEGTKDTRHGTAILTWQIWNGTIPDYFLVERADRTLRPMTNDSQFMRPGPYGFNRGLASSRQRIARLSSSFDAVAGLHDAGALGRGLGADRPHIDDGERAADRIGGEFRRAALRQRLVGDGRRRRCDQGRENEERAEKSHDDCLVKRLAFCIRGGDTTGSLDGRVSGEKPAGFRAYVPQRRGSRPIA